MFVFICKIENSILDDKFRDIIFEVIISKNFVNGFDRSHQFWRKFNVRDEILKKKLGYYDTEDLEDPYLIALVINPKE